jgi:hypothetical protein
MTAMPDDLSPLEVEFLRFVEAEVAAAQRDVRYVDSLDQFYAQEEFLERTARGTVLVRGPNSFWEPATISLRIEQADEPGESARQTSIVLLHEILHQTYTATADLATAYRNVVAFSQGRPVEVARVADAAFQWLEDERVSRLGARDFPSLRSYLGEFDVAMPREFEASYSERYGESPWTTDPVSPERQFLGALTYRIFASSSRMPTTKPSVADLIAEVGAWVDEAVIGATVMNASSNAIRIGQTYANRMPL